MEVCARVAATTKAMWWVLWKEFINPGGDQVPPGKHSVAFQISGQSAWSNLSHLLTGVSLYPGLEDECKVQKLARVYGRLSYRPAQRVKNLSLMSHRGYTGLGNA